MERLLNMILRKGLNRVVNTGLKSASRQRSDQDDDPQVRQAAKRQARQTQQTFRGLRTATRVLRRIGKP